MSEVDIITKVIPGNGGDVGRIILNRPKQLNALSFSMIREIKNCLEQWAIQPTIKAVIISAVGERAFCAGGDIRTMYTLCRETKDDQAAFQFFHDEYEMNRLLFHFPKPYLSFLDGLTMGGGAGISVHGSHPIATEKLVLAMPETGIGFFPDVGMGYYFSRMPDYMGYYLGLTGSRLSAKDTYALGLVKAIVPASELNTLEKALIEREFDASNDQIVDDIIAEFHRSDIKIDSMIDEHRNDIAEFFCAHSLQEILERLHHADNDWCLSMADLLAQKSPLALAVTYQHLQHCQEINFDQVIDENFRLVKHFVADHDFMEGIRAAVVDKDRSPQWQPDQLEKVNAAQLQSYFES